MSMGVQIAVERGSNGKEKLSMTRLTRSTVRGTATLMGFKEREGVLPRLVFAAQTDGTQLRF
jgi:hypothetical protein